MLALLSQRNFRLLWVAHTVSIIGDYVFFIAITFWIYEQTNSAAATGAILIVSMLPALLFAPLAGILADRWHRRRIMFVAETVRAALFLGLLGALFVQPHTLWPIYVVGFAQTALATFFWTARTALLPQLIKPASLFAANALYLVSDSGVRVIAPSISALILLHFGPSGVTVLDAASFLVSAGSICLLNPVLLQPLAAQSPLEKQAPSTTPDESPVTPSPLRKAGALKQKAWSPTPHLSTLYRLGGLFTLGAIITYTTGTLSILFPVFVRTLFSTGPAAYGWLLTAQALGEGAISLLLGQTQKPRGRVRTILFLSSYLAIGGTALILMAQFHTLVPSLLLSLIFGAMTAAITIQLLTFLQQHVANHLLGRLLASYSAIQALAQVVGLVVASITVSSIGVIWLFTLNGILYLFGATLAWTLLTAADDSTNAP